jgi:hydrogenase expression/formation protein HypD
METILSAPDNTVQGFLAAGHVCTVMGTSEYVPLAERHRIPVVVTGFEPADLLQGILRTVSMLEAGRNGVEIQYARVVRPGGNPEARRVLDRVFRATDRAWRGIGTIPASGLALREEFAEFDAERRFDVAGATAPESPECAAGDVLRGRRKPVECAAYGVRCTPDRPLGAPMVSSEGACAAYWNAGRRA